MLFFFVVFRSFSHNFPLGAPVCTSSRPVKPEIMRNTMKHALKLIFLKCIFEFVINTAPTVSNSVYGREKLFWYDKINFSYHMCHCGAVVQELLARKDKPGSTPGDAVFCFFVPFFFFPVWSLFFTLFFLFGLFFFILTADPAGHALGSKKLKSRVLFWERDFKSSWSAYWPSLRPYKNHKPCQEMSLLYNSWIFFSMLVDIMTNNTQYTTNCTNLHPTPTSDPLAKVKLAFCTSS